MRQSLKKLLEKVIDYAGLFPPAEYGMKKAVTEYMELTSSGDEWIVDKFVCPVSKLDELIGVLGQVADPTRVTAIGTFEPDSVAEAALSDTAAIARAQESGVVLVETYEAKVLQGDGLASAVSAIKKVQKASGIGALDVYVEVGWGEFMVDSIHDVANHFEEAGFKARTGGVSANLFPSAEELAAFLSECSALEVPFKFTAGLHSPIRYYDETLGTYRHGFLNAILAGALAVSHDLTKREIEQVLMNDDASNFHFGYDDIRAGEHWIEAQQIDDFWDIFGGFGSCSVSEPLEGLEKLGLILEQAD